MPGRSNTIQLQVNGKRHRLRVQPDETLLHVLRTRLGLTGAKKGCGTGQCGACTVIMDGQAINSCIVLARQAQGSSILTIEGLGSRDRPHALQEAFLDYGAVQCGFCTPGAIMAAKAMLDRNPAPTREEIKDELSGNLCRCTGYGPLIEAVAAVARGTWSAGTSPRRQDGLDKVLGSTRFAGDLDFPGMLFARTFRSTVPHATIVALNVTKAASAPGVVAVLTAKDIPGAAKFGTIVPDQWVLAPVGEPVRMVGDPLALVAAWSEVEAREAMGLIEAEYRALPVLHKPEQALSPGAAPVHPGKEDNVCSRITQAQGDLAQGLAEANAVEGRSFHTPVQEHAFLEPEVTVAVPEPDGSLTVYCPTQAPLPLRKTVAQALGLPEDMVRVVTTPVGGAFGGKVDLSNQAHAALLAMHTGRPVRLEWSREESILAHPKRHPLHLHGRLAADGEGRLTALEATVVGDAGAYTGPSSLALLLTLSSMTGAYDFPNVKASGVMAFTNNPSFGLLRGMGGLTANILRESLVDALAQCLGLDPVEFRRRNIIQEGATPVFPGVVLDGPITAEEVMDRALAAAGSLVVSPNTHRSSGRGLCLAMPPFQIGAKPRSASARVELIEDGTAVVHTGVLELGNGVTTSLAQMVAGELGIRFEDVKVIYGDTARCPVGTPAVGSGQTYTSGNAVRQAAQELKARIAEQASQILEAPPEILVFRDGKMMVAEAPHRSVTLARLAGACQEQGISLIEEATFSASHAGWGHSFAATVADVQVDRETGDVEVIQVISALDTGPVINRQNVEGQMLGAAVQSQGFVTMEEVILDKAMPLTRGLEDYRIPTTLDAPARFLPITVEEPYPTGPYGAKGIGEHGIYTVGPAIFCAIENALGVRLEGFPATPERILRAMKNRY